MLITSPCVVSLTWKLQDTQGVLIDELKDPVEFFFGGDDLLAKVEEALTDQEAGFTTTLHLEPEHAFGDYDPALVFFEERAIFPAAEAIEVGMQFDGVPPGAVTKGMPAEAIYTVTEAYPGHVVLDGNHPLAGIALRLELVVRDVRAATEQETETRSVGQPAFTVMNTVPVGTPLH
jgi:FKBP-type peptidyl-prolyl cis-trans isomerase SlyD